MGGANFFLKSNDSTHSVVTGAGVHCAQLFTMSWLIVQVQESVYKPETSNYVCNVINICMDTLSLTELLVLFRIQRTRITRTLHMSSVNMLSQPLLFIIVVLYQKSRSLLNYETKALTLDFNPLHNILHQV